MSETTPEQAEKATTHPFTSGLSRGRERFLAHVIDQGLEVGQRTPEDFLRHFPPMALMEALSEQPKLRAEIVVHTTGTKQRIALKKSWQSAGEDLQIALEEKETDAASVLNMLDLDDRVRYLDATKIWEYVTEGEFWNVAVNQSRDLERARAHLTFMLERALEDRLLTHKDIVEGITVDELAARLPKSELGNIIKLSLANAQSEAPFTEKDLLAAVPPSVLVSYIPLPHLWSKVVVPKIAERHGYVEASQPGAVADVASDEPTSSKKADAQAALPAMPSVPAASGTASRSSAANTNAAKATPADNKSEVAVKQPGPAKAGKSTIDTTSWSAEIDEADLLEEDDLDLVNVANS